MTFTCKDCVEPLSEVKNFGEEVVYQANPVLQFSAFTNQAHQLCEAGALYASAEFLEHKNLKDGDMVHITNEEGDKLVIAIKLDPHTAGLIPYLPTFDTKIDVTPFFKDGYRFAKLTIKGVNHE